MLASVHGFLGHLHSRDNARISSAAADVTFECTANFRFTRVRSLLQESNAGEDHSGSAITALHGVGLDEGFLQRMEAAVLRQPFDGGDFFARDLGHLRDAGAHRRAIDEHGAGSAVAFATAIFAAGEFQLVAEDPEQEAVGVQLEPVMRLIDDKFHALILRPAEIPARRRHNNAYELVLYALTELGRMALYALAMGFIGMVLAYVESVLKRITTDESILLLISYFVSGGYLML